MKTVWCQPWLYRDSWSGPELNGASLHLTKRGLDGFVDREVGNRSGPVPSYYISPEPEAHKVKVSERIVKRIRACREGLQLTQSEYEKMSVKALL